MFRNKVALLVVLVVLATVRPVIARLVEDTHVDLSRRTFDVAGETFVDYSLRAFSTPEADRPSHGGFVLNLDGEITSGGAPLDGGGSGWFLVDEGDAISRETIGDPTADPSGVSLREWPDSIYPYIFDTGFELTTGNQYIIGIARPVIATDEIEGEFGKFTPDAFGWLKVEVVDGNPNYLNMVDNAIVYGGAGIIAGQNVIVPEPSTLALAIPLLLLALRKRQLRRPRHRQLV